MSGCTRILSLALMLLIPALTFGAPQDNLEVKGQLQPDDPKDPARQQPSKVHEIKLSKGKGYQIDLMSADFDSYLRLLDATGKEVASDDDGGDKFNSRIKYTPTDDGTYKVVVTTFAGGAGNYVLKVQGGAAGPVVGKQGAEEVVLNVAGNLQLNDPVDPARNQPAKVYEVKLKKGTKYQLDLISPNFDCFMRLVDDKGTQLAEDDDGGDRLNSRILYVPLQDGAFKIYASSLGGGQGNFNLSVKSVVPGAGAKVTQLAAPTAAKASEHADQLQATDARDPVRRQPAKIHTVELKAGKTYTINLVSQFDNYLRLENAAGQQLAADDDGGGNLNARIVFACPADGQYRIIATSFGGGTGPYNLQVSE
ncbi:MAG: PPC domain-containing protein [Planctomycetota bacterium]